MLPRELMSLVNKVERSSNLHLRYMGVDCWPIVRNTFMTMMSHDFPKQSKKLALRAYLRALYDFCYSLCCIGKADAVALTDIKFQTKVNGKLYYKEVSVIKELLTNSGQCCHIFTQNSPTKNGGDAQGRSVFFLTALAVLLSKILMRLDFQKVVTTYLQDIYSSPELESLNFDALRNSKQVRQNIYFVIVASFLFKLLLKRIRPKKCFIVCYYSCLGMALCVACKQLGIESIDLQHGVSGTNMRAYGQWNNLPEGGLNTLPQLFYCWTPIDASAINSWAVNNQYHKAVLTGNIWRQYLVEKDHLRLPEELELTNEVKSYHKVLLYTARTPDLPKLILDLIKAMPKGYFLMVRMHPNMASSELLTVSEKLKLINASCSVAKATKARIHTCMQLADLHITEWSASVYDALFENTPSIVISKLGRDYFDDFISQGCVVYCSEVNGIIERAEAIIRKESAHVGLIDLENIKDLF